jgi:hypothetical protein
MLPKQCWGTGWENSQPKSGKPDCDNLEARSAALYLANEFPPTFH